MRIPVIEELRQIIEHTKIAKLQPSSFAALLYGCKYQYILNAVIQSNKLYQLPITPKAILGSIIHKIIELRYSGIIKTETDFDTTWHSLLKEKEIENYGEAGKGFLTDWIKYSKTKKVIFAIPLYKSVDSERGKTCEVAIWGVDYIHGIIDKINISNDTIEIIDFKTGVLYDDAGNVKEAYAVQLKLYALLYQLNYNKKVSKLTLIDIDGKKESICFTQEDLESLYRQVIDMVDLLNQGSKELLISKDIDKNCLYCKSRHLCDDYWEGEILPIDVNGFVEDVNNYGLITMKRENEETMIVTQMSYYSVNELKEIIGKNVRIVTLSVSKVMHYGKLYKGKKWSRIYVVK
ncbi:hypothetical protein M2459_001579 [Parabacteroides sp. PF5-5]|uniref:PD-(D/E)XK nuclease family protein n=1 Tax=unclassified Parabacteroides TaxID=2649774 RepID=UPI00247633E3|nr:MULTISPECIES: PD-(D/E)XK nuclease family protein [unclassified Parabacteroides]MDH6304841.1 hypothetical protein [Parabacteroides sp. PH5-39]MDH6316073.1 hypothetical protein [Parabacteroides sp. PF5-13]MDH6319730.1 hypothetical protein [Parabacteroides sp. PH5-13]MDH6323461.1 hypothetical protein [Parabacteroides sp. PH5-8]MDH6327031.1 hypothetical protein [Parabacteroides sp. PH5-41]